MGNAIKFTSQGSVTLRVSALSHPPQPTTNHRFHARSAVQSTLHFEVEDTGPGIAPEELDIIFEAFTQTATGRKSLEGTGLGLPISRKFVQLMGGDISVCSTLGQGTNFQFDIAIGLASGAEISILQPTRRVIGIEAGQPEYRILVVDDVKESRLFLVKLLASVGFSVQDAANGQEAIDRWSAFQPHLIWMDMRMPVIDGYEATRRIKAMERERWGDGETGGWGD
ncbi:MAG TPA: ATP-binding protein, partial [Allocoleopsis sp.]